VTSITTSFSNSPGFSNVPRFDGQCGAVPATIEWVFPTHLPLMSGTLSAANAGWKHATNSHGAHERRPGAWNSRHCLILQK
jgi:hypothetical protein